MGRGSKHNLHRDEWEQRRTEFCARRIATEAYRRGVADGQKINAAVAVMFGEQPHE